MSTWVDELAGALGVEPLGPDETSRLLAASRDVAHNTERRFTPLALFLLGRAAEREIASGSRSVDAVRAAVATLEDLIPEPGPGDVP